MRFTKMQGTGNDYIYVNCFEEKIENPSALAVAVSDRHFGVGGDGLILILPSGKADCKMSMFNADGSEAQMCGNGIRCVGKYIYDHGITDKTTVTVETLAGIKTLGLNIEDSKVQSVRVDMGEPEFFPPRIPVKAEGDSFVNQPLEIAGRTWQVTAVSVGNPHAVIPVEDVKSLELERIGPLFENHAFFPERINTEFFRVIDRENLEMRVWERGSGETLACGTGATATLAACVLNDLCGRRANVRLLGGVLQIEWDETDNHLYMTGPAVEVFSGEYSTV